MSERAYRTNQELLEELCEHVHTCCELLLAINQRLGAQGAASSVEVKTSTRGVDITTKAYANSPITEAGDAAMDEFIRVGKEVERRLMGQA